MSQSSSPHHPLLTRERDSAASSGSGKRSSQEDLSVIPPDANPDAIVERVLSLLSEERYHTARRLALKAAARFPEHPRLQTAKRIFDSRGEAIRRPGSEPSRSEEFAWLDDPPESARGRWVALLGSELIGSAEELRDLTELLKTKSLPKPALVHFVE